MAARAWRIPTPLTATRALREFVALERGGSLLLLAGAVVALIWANSPWQDAYARLWATHASIEVGGHVLELDLREWINEGLMTVFFFVVALEIKRARTEGELRDWRNAALPAIAAVGGMVLPAALFLALNTGSTSHGWGIPMATDIAFAIGVANLARPDLPGSLRVFLLTLAIVDDLGAIVVIVVFYSSGLEPVWLLVAGGLVGVVAVLRERVSYTTLAVIVGIPLWLTVHEAGVHPTVAGIALGLLAPASPVLSREVVERSRAQLTDVFSAKAARETVQVAKHAVSELEWLEHLLHPWSSLVIVPVFALANTGVSLALGDLSDALVSRVALGIVAGLVVGKTAGITFATWVAKRAGFDLPEGATWSSLVAVAALGGIGFTVALFVTDLAYADAADTQAAKVGVLSASILAAATGALLLARTRVPGDGADGAARGAAAPAPRPR